MKLGRDEFVWFTLFDDEFNALTDTLASPLGYLLEELHHLFTSECGEADLILEWSHI